MRRQLLLLSKSYLYLFRKSRTKFPADWRNIYFYQAENLKFVCSKKSTCLISLEHELRTRLSGDQGLSTSDLTSQEKEKLLFSFFFLHSSRPTHVQIRTHTYTHAHTPCSTSYSTWYKKKCSLLHCVTSPLPLDLCYVNKLEKKITTRCFSGRLTISVEIILSPP